MVACVYFGWIKTKTMHYNIGENIWGAILKAVGGLANRERGYVG